MGAEDLVQTEIVEDFPGVRADLQAGTEFGNGGAAFEHDDLGAEFCQGKGQRQAGYARARDIVCAARAGHGRAQAASAWKIAESGLDVPAARRELNT
ncbi:hypothetical protein D3C85_1625840 [compost metagenome]